MWKAPVYFNQKVKVQRSNPIAGQYGSTYIFVGGCEIRLTHHFETRAKTIRFATVFTGEANQKPFFLGGAKWFSSIHSIFVGAGGRERGLWGEPPSHGCVGPQC